MCRTRDPVAVAWLLRHATDEDRTAGGHAQAVAEAVSLAEVLESGEVDHDVVVQAGRLLQALTLAEDYFPLRGYDGVRRAVAAFAIRAAEASPVPDLIAAAATLAEDLISGHAACLPWPPGVREMTLERLVRLLTSVRWAQVLAEADRSPEAMTRWRAGWARRTIDALPSAPEPREDRHAGHDRLAVRVVVPDPALSELVQTRLLVNGRTVVAEAFGAGGPYRPERLLGDLVVTDEPRQVRLAEAYCTEGCCGALYVTIARDGDAVVWRDWRDSSGKAVTLTPFRFAPDSYEEVVAHAVGDHRWEWPARTLARKVHRALHENPGLLSAWECELCDVHAAVGRQDEIEVIFWHPRRPALLEDDGPDEDEEPWLQFSWTVPVDGTNVNSQAGRVVKWLGGNDPKGCAEVVGGSRKFADRLGFPWPTCPGEED